MAGGTHFSVSIDFSGKTLKMLGFWTILDKASRILRAIPAVQPLPVSRKTVLHDPACAAKQHQDPFSACTDNGTGLPSQAAITVQEMEEDSGRKA